MSDIEIVTIIANGAAPQEDVLRQNLKGTNILIAADGGAETCRKLGLDPQYIVGDLDSVSDETIEYFSQTKIVHIPDQDTTDLEKSIIFAERFFPRKIRIFSAAGNRSDHYINNLLFFWNYPNNRILEIFDDQGVMKVLCPGEHQIEGFPGDIISLFSFSAVTGIKFTNFRYIPKQSDFTDSFCSISNVLMTEKGIISLQSGKLFIYRLF
ncbi:MAG: thiamine diphosphokinase [Candidatus Cloacimonadales bacterium]|nr:thiamine diphosphokinase [Candidatus Cloacimonadales bacterium]